MTTESRLAGALQATGSGSLPRRTHLAAALALAAYSAFAAEYYVNCNMSDYTGHDGSTPEKAYETIQQAVARPNGSVIHVAPGRYDKGLGQDVVYDFMSSSMKTREETIR